jgi:Transcription factor WhiB
MTSRVRVGRFDTAGWSWRRFAACSVRLDLDWIDPSAADAVECREVCAACPVQRQCRTTALRTREPWGIWGGLTPYERTDLAVLEGIPSPRILPPHGTNSRYAKWGCACNDCRYAHTLHERDRRRRHREPPSYETRRHA